jgi:TP901 family phage tail tape measure protein
MQLGATVKLSNQAEFVKGLMEITQQIKKYKAEVGLASAETAKNSSSFESLQTRIRATGNLLESQKNLYNQLSSQLGVLRTQHEKNGQVHQKLVNSYNTEKEKLEKLGSTLGKSSSEYKAQEKVVQSLGEKVKISAQNHEKNQKEIDNTEVKLIKANTAYIKTETTLRGLNEKLKDNVVSSEAAGQANSRLQQITERQENQLQRLKEKYQQVSQEQGENSKSAKALEASIQKVADSLETNKEKLQAAGENTKKYNEAVAEHSNASGIFAKGADLMTGVVIGLGVTIAQQGIQKLKELAAASLEAGMAFEKGMSVVEALSGATGADLRSLNEKAQELGRNTQFTATNITEMMKYMALAGWDTHEMLEGIDGVWQLAAASGEDFARVADIVTDAITAMGMQTSESTRLVDVMAATATSSNTTIGLMGEAFQYVAPIAGRLNYSIEDLSLAMGTLADNGIKGEKAGTALRNVITRLIDPPKKAKEWIDKLGISVKDSKGNMLPFSAVISQLREKFSKLSDAEKVEAATNIAGKQAMAGFLAIVNTSPGNLTKLKTAIDQSEGAGKKMADTMMNNGKGAITLLTSKIEGLQIALYQKLKPAFDKAIGVANNMADAFKFLIDNSTVVMGVFSSLSTGLTAFKLAGVNFVDVFKNIKEGITSFLTSLNPVQLAIGATAAALMGLYHAYQAHEEYKKSLLEADDWIKAQAEAVDKIIESRDKLVESQQKSIDEHMTEMTNATVLAEELNNLVDVNGKVKKGYEERANYITTELSKALGIEINNNNGVIQNYKDIQKEIQETIKKKRAKAILDAQEVLYTDAMKNQMSVLKDKAKQEKEIAEAKVNVAKWTAEVKKEEEKLQNVISSGLTDDSTVEILQQRVQVAKDSLTKANSNLGGLQETYDKTKQLNDKYSFDIAQYYKNSELMANGHYDKMTNIQWSYMEKFKNTEDAKLREIQANLASEQDAHDNYKRLYEETNEDMYKTQMDASQKRIEQLQNDLKAHLSTVGEHLKDINDLWNEETTKTLNELTGKTWTFQQNAEGHVLAYANGVLQKTGTAKEVFDYLVEYAQNPLKEGENTAHEIGKNTGENLAQGVEEQSGKAHEAGEELGNNVSEGMASKQDEAKSEGLTIGDAAAQALLGKKSDFFEIGKFLIDGLVSGIRGEIPGLIKGIWDLGTNLVKTLQKAVDERSPSKATFKIGAFFTQGLLNGILDDSDNVVKQTGKLGEKVTEALQKNMGAVELQNVQFGLSQNVGALATKQSIPASMRANTWEAGSSGAVEWEEIFTNAFTKALYKMQDKFEIKLNGERLGEFVDKRVDNLIYQ